jgi:hypothetical protein
VAVSTFSERKYVLSQAHVIISCHSSSRFTGPTLFDSLNDASFAHAPLTSLNMASRVQPVRGRVLACVVEPCASTPPPPRDHLRRSPAPPQAVRRGRRSPARADIARMSGHLTERNSGEDDNGPGPNMQADTIIVNRHCSCRDAGGGRWRAAPAARSVRRAASVTWSRFDPDSLIRWRHAGGGRRAAGSGRRAAGWPVRRRCP